MISFLTAHLAGSVILESLLELAGYEVFDDSGSNVNALIDTSKHKTRLYSYILLLDFCSKSLYRKGVEGKLALPDSLKTYFNSIVKVDVKDDIEESVNTSYAGFGNKDNS